MGRIEQKRFHRIPIDPKYNTRFSEAFRRVCGDEYPAGDRDKIFRDTFAKWERAAAERCYTGICGIWLLLPRRLFLTPLGEARVFVKWLKGEGGRDNCPPRGGSKVTLPMAAAPARSTKGNKRIVTTDPTVTAAKAASATGGVLLGGYLLYKIGRAIAVSCFATPLAGAASLVVP